MRQLSNPHLPSERWSRFKHCSQASSHGGDSLTRGPFDVMAGFSQNHTLGPSLLHHPPHNIDNCYQKAETPHHRLTSPTTRFLPAHIPAHLPLHKFKSLSLPITHIRTDSASRYQCDSWFGCQSIRVADRHNRLTSERSSSSRLSHPTHSKQLLRCSHVASISTQRL